MKDQSISTVFLQVRTEMGLTQRELAKILKCSQAAISSWENDSRVPCYSTMKALDNFITKNKLNIRIFP